MNPTVKDPNTLRGMVAAAVPAAAEAGASMLRRGGTAADAACAAAFALAVCEPGESGLGGLTTLMVREESGRCTVIDGHSRGPAGLSRAQVKGASQHRGIRSVAVPSTVTTLGQLHARHGRLSLSLVLEPAIGLAMEGFRVSALQRRLIRWMQPYFGAGSIEARTFQSPSGKAPRVGDVIRQPMLAATLARIATCGTDDFTKGAIGVEFIRDMEERGGFMTLRDLAEESRPRLREPLRVDLCGRTLLAPPPPSGGVQVLLAMRLLGLFRADESPSSDGWYVAMAKALHTAFRERERWPDHPADMSPSMDRWVVSEARAQMLAERVRRGGEEPPVLDSMDEDSASDVADLSEGDEGGGLGGNTTHLCAWDEAGMVVSLTQSIQSVFGAKILHPTLGFVYNNYLSTCPRHPHPYRLGPSCMPQSNASPMLVLGGSGAPVAALGSAGSRRITTSIVTTLSAYLDLGDSPREAVSRPRAHALLSRKVWAEQSVPRGAIRALERAIGPVRLLEDRHYKLGAVHMIGLDAQGRLAGAADPRRDGAVAIATAGDNA